MDIEQPTSGGVITAPCRRVGAADAPYPTDDKTKAPMPAKIGLCRRISGILVFTMLVVSIGAAAAATVVAFRNLHSRSRTDDSAFDDTEWFNNAEERRIGMMRYLLENIENELVFSEPQSPQSRSLDWLLYDDRLLMTAESPNFLQRYAIFVFYFATNGQKWRGVNESWTKRRDVHECSFEGIICDAYGQITDIELVNRNLIGSLPQDIGLLSHLRLLVLEHNKLQGSIPSDLFQKLTNMERLNLSLNGIQSTISSHIGSMSRLKELHLFSTMMDGKIPDAIERLTKLEIINLSGSEFTGDIMTPMQKFTNLRYLDIGSSKLSGMITSDLTNLRDLEYFSTYGSMVGGSIPSGIGMLSLLRYLGLSGQQLTGTIPSELGLLTKLETIYLGISEISGKIPTELGKLVQLEELSFVQTDISGPIPSEIGNLGNLRILQLLVNNFSGFVPIELGDLSNMDSITLKDNPLLKGTIPSGLCETGAMITYSCQLQCPCCPSPCE